MNGLSTTLGNLLPAALGVALSPVPIIATVLMLMSGQPRRTAPALAVGSATARPRAMLGQGIGGLLG